MLPFTSSYFSLFLFTGMNFLEKSNFDISIMFKLRTVMLYRITNHKLVILFTMDFGFFNVFRIKRYECWTVQLMNFESLISSISSYPGSKISIIV